VINRLLYICLVTIIVAGSIFITGCTPESITTTGTVTATQTNQSTTITQVPTSDISEGSPSAEELMDQGFKSPEIPRLTSETLKKIIDAGLSFILVDVRSESSFYRVHIPQSINFHQIMRLTGAICIEK